MNQNKEPLESTNEEVRKSVSIDELLRVFPEDRATTNPVTLEHHSKDESYHTPSLPDIVVYPIRDRKSTRLNSSHVAISYAVFCLKKKTIMYYTENAVVTILED